MKTIKRITELLAVNEKHHLLSAWEVQFLTSVKGQSDRRALSSRQNDIVQKIEAKLSKAKIQEAQAWIDGWGGEKARIARVIAEYYAATSYFTALSRQILEDPEYVPSKAAYEKMCQNKYAKRVLEIVDAAPAYPDGSTVMLRATAKNTLSFAKFNKLKECPLFVLRVLPHVTSPAKGAKLYEVLSGTSCDVFRIEERLLKTYRVPKAKHAV